MANKRNREKQRQAQYKRTLERKGYSRKEIKRTPKREREQIHNKEIRRQEYNKKRQEDRQKKRAFIDQNDLKDASLYSIWTKKKLFKESPNTGWSWKDLEKLKRKAQKDRLEKERIRQLVDAGYPLEKIKQSDVASQAKTDSIINRIRDGGFDIDWNKVYTFEPILICYRDLTQETNLATIIRDYLSMSIENLLRELYRIVQLPQTYIGKGSDSSGGCGQAKIYQGEDAEYSYQFDEMQAKTRFRNRRKYKKSYKTYIKYDKINSGSITSASLKNLIAIAVSVLNNIFEGERPLFWNDFRDVLIDIEPEVEKYIPDRELVY